MKYLFLPLLTAIVLVSCQNQASKNQEMPVARVNSLYLYASDLEGVVPRGLTEIDSLALVKDYIEKWVRKQLILSKADENLTDEDKNVEKQIEDYRSSLLIFKYEQNLLQQKLDTVITADEIEEYYNENSSNFILNDHLVKALYIKVPRSAPTIWKLRKWYKSDDKEDIKKLEAYCFNNADKYDYFNDDWIEFNVIEEQLPKLYQSTASILRTRQTLEIGDSNYIYFVRFFDYRLRGTTEPIEYIDYKIKSIILNKRKIQYIKKIENKIYNDAANHGNFNIY